MFLHFVINIWFSTLKNQSQRPKKNSWVALCYGWKGAIEQEWVGSAILGRSIYSTFLFLPLWEEMGVFLLFAAV